MYYDVWFKIQIVEDVVTIVRLSLVSDMKN